MTLAQTQSAFMAQVLDEDAPVPDGWSTRQSRGMAVYRNNYRGALVDALFETFERTARWVGETSFRQAAAHHLIAHPPASWTIDEAGRGFDATCAELFAKDPEVAELAWLEWAMFDAFTAPDCSPLDPTGFAQATAGFEEADWGRLKLAFVPGAVAEKVSFDLAAIWNALGEDDLSRPELGPPSSRGCIVWREGERPTFTMVAAEEVAVFKTIAAGAAFGDACALLVDAQETEEQAAMQAGAVLGRWLGEGLVSFLSS